jgi:3-hydroxyacyl-CoA dehydrogenase
MGGAIAQAFIQCGFKAALIDKEAEILKKAEEGIMKGLGKLIDFEKIKE